MFFPYPCEGEDLAIIPDWTDQPDDPPGDFLDAHEDAEIALLWE